METAVTLDRAVRSGIASGVFANCGYMRSCPPSRFRLTVLMHVRTGRNGPHVLDGATGGVRRAA